MARQSSLEKAVADFIADTSKIECVKAILKELRAKQDDQQIRAIVAINKISSHLFVSKQNFLRPSPENALSVEFASAWSHLLEVLAAAQAASELATQTLLKWIQVETIMGSTEEKYVFPESRLESFIAVLCGDKKDMRVHIGKLVEELEKFDDLNYFICKALWKISDKFTKSATELAIWNYFALLKGIRVRDKLMKEEHISTIGDLDNFPFSDKELRKYYQYAWVNFLRASLPEKLYIHVLVVLDDKKVALFKNPCILGDFLIESYNKGGAVALLALNGLFTLIHKYNLELPDFYTRLYALFRPEIFYTKYRARFFFLADVFLSSTHLPAYLVAAFAKKMARLCLTAPAYSQLHVIPFIGNLIIRHAALGRMVNCEEVKNLNSDPFEESETDPAKSRALESSLWELDTLQHHWLYHAATKAGIVDKTFPKIEWDFSDLLESDYSILFETEKFKGTVPTNYHKPWGLFRYADDCMAMNWALE